jgi:hypothetical protein
VFQHCTLPADVRLAIVRAGFGDESLDCVQLTDAALRQFITVVMSACPSRIPGRRRKAKSPCQRRVLGVGPGSVLEWAEDGDHIVVRRAGRFSLDDVHRTDAARPGDCGGGCRALSKASGGRVFRPPCPRTRAEGGAPAPHDVRSKSGQTRGRNQAVPGRAMMSSVRAARTSKSTMSVPPSFVGDLRWTATWGTAPSRAARSPRETPASQAALPRLRPPLPRRLAAPPEWTRRTLR